MNKQTGGTVRSLLKDLGILARESIGGVVGGIVHHFFMTKLNSQGQPIVVDGKEVKTLDMSKVRDHAPHFAKTHMDEAEFAALKTNLDPALLKSMEGWMSSLEMHQRADVILTVAEMTARMDLAADNIANRRMAREAAYKALEQLASVTDVAILGNPRGIWAPKDAHAVAFKFMKANENEYLGAQLSAQASAALVALIAEFRQAKQDWDNLMVLTAGDIDASVQQMRQARVDRNLVRAQGSWWERFQQSRRRLSSFPWE